MYIYLTRAQQTVATPGPRKGRSAALPPAAPSSRVSHVRPAIQAEEAGPRRHPELRGSRDRTGRDNKPTHRPTPAANRFKLPNDHHLHDESLAAVDQGRLSVPAMGPGEPGPPPWVTQNGPRGGVSAGQTPGATSHLLPDKALGEAGIHICIYIHIFINTDMY